MTQDPYASYLQQADALFAAGDVVKAGQIWQAILKREPAHGPAREGLLKVKAILDQPKAEAVASAPPEPEPAPPAAPVAPVAPPGPSQDELDLMVRQGCTLYDMGQVEDALGKWEEVLVHAPNHAMALEYAGGARKELGLAPGAPAGLPAPAPAAPAKAPEAAAVKPAGDPSEIDALLRGAAQLYDMGVVEEAMDKWRKVLELDPDHEQARSFIRMAEKEEAENRQRWAAATSAMTSQAPASPAPASPLPSTPGHVQSSPLADATVAMPSQLHGQEPRLAQARHLLETGHANEAVHAFRQLVEENPNNQEARNGLAQAQAALVTSTAPPGQGQRLMADWVVATKSVPVPAAVTSAAPPKRGGLQIPEVLRAIQLPPWVLTPTFLGGVAGGFLALGIGLHFYRAAQQDRRLLADVQAALQAAKAPVAKATAIADLDESPAAILAEGQKALKDDPLRAYHRAKEVLRRAPSDGAAAQLLERARLALVPLGSTPVTRAEADAAFRDRDLVKADRLMDAVLRADPENRELLLRATRLLSLLAQAHAAGGEWDEAREALLRARALAPQDRTWNARLSLVDRIKDQPRQEQPGWIALL